MTVTLPQDVNELFNPGDVVWACAYEPYKHQSDKRNLFCKPIKGKLTRSNYSDKTEYRYRQNGYNEINYFVPFKKNSTELAWSKAVNYVARVYAESEEECIELYNYLIDHVIEFHQNAIDRAKADKITK